MKQKSIYIKDITPITLFWCGFIFMYYIMLFFVYSVILEHWKSYGSVLSSDIILVCIVIITTFVLASFKRELKGSERYYDANKNKQNAEQVNGSGNTPSNAPLNVVNINKCAPDKRKNYCKQAVSFKTDGSVIFVFPFSGDCGERVRYKTGKNLDNASGNGNHNPVEYRIVWECLDCNEKEGIEQRECNNNGDNQGLEITRHNTN